jgi:altronate hydrolase
VLPTVGCVNRQAQSIVEAFLKRHDELEVDDVHAFSHPYGCSQMGDDHINTRQTLQNIAKHPNFGGVLVLGLGCENNQISTFKATLGEYDDTRIRFLVCQDVTDEIEAGADILDELYEIARQDKRTMQPLSKINIGLKCGGSDGLSGITANPLIGHISDYIVSQGGSAVLTEIPEMFGAENVLLERCETKKVFDRLVGIIDDFKDYYRSHNQVIYENPSPGNKEGGITTLEDKSLGCVQKSGSTRVVGILDHTERLNKAGLNILSAPGNDMVATTALGMCGCQLVLFSTGRGTPFGGFIPTVKISTNTSLYERKPNWIDFDSGDISDRHYEAKVENLIDLVIEVIEGKKTRNEINEFREIAIFKKGVTL